MKKLSLAVLSLLVFSACAFAQDYVGRYDFYTGYSWQDSPQFNLEQRGVNMQLGRNLTRWLQVGLDYSVQMGAGTLLPNETKYANGPYGLNTLVSYAEHGAFDEAPPNGCGCVLPGNYYAYLPFTATTQNFGFTPQIVWRNRRKFSGFLHPSLGLIHENISLESHDAFTQYVALPDLLGRAPGFISSPVIRTPRPNDTKFFIGFGGGLEYSLTSHFKVRTDLEYEHVYLFDSLLANPRNSLRLSIGPAFSFGRNVKQ